MQTMETIYEEMKAKLGELTGLTVTDGGDLTLRLYAVAAQLYSLWEQAEFVLRQCFPQTAEGVYTVRHRLYELEERLDRQQFVRISHSEIVNLRQVTGLDLGLTGTIRMTLTGGVTTYVSRRYVKKIKEVLGL